MKKLRIAISTHITRALMKRALAFFMGVLVLSGGVSAMEPVKNDSIKVKAVSGHSDSFFPDKGVSLENSHFTWGAEAGASIDISGYDMSTFDVDLLVGYKNKAIRILGVGVGVHRSVQTGDNFIPVYATIQTSFRSKPSLFFFSAKIGYSFNTISNSPMFGDTMSTIGCGINLSKSRVASSYILVSAGSRYFNNRHIDQFDRIDRHYVFIASLAVGVSF